MDTLEHYRDSIEKILKEHASIPYSHGQINQDVIIDGDRNHFLLMNTGWV